MRNRQQGPSGPLATLAKLVANLTYKPGWTFELREVDRGQGCHGLTLIIAADVPNSQGPGTVSIAHLMPVPAAAYDPWSWEEWLLDQIMLVERHETLEFFRIAGVASFFPEHRPGVDPYRIVRVNEPKSVEHVNASADVWHGLPATYE